MRHISQLRQGAKDLTEIIKHHFTSSCLASQQVNQKFKICFLSSFVVGQERTSQPVRERLQMGTRTWTCRSSRQGKDFLTCIKCITDCLSNLHDSDQISTWGTIFPPKISVRGTKIFRTKIPVTAQCMT